MVCNSTRYDPAGYFFISPLNKTRETRVLSRLAIFWIHYVQIALSISAEHLSQAFQPSISAEHLSNPKKRLSIAQRCLLMLRNAQEL